MASKRMTGSEMISVPRNDLELVLEMARAGFLVEERQHREQHPSIVAIDKAALLRVWRTVFPGGTPYGVREDDDV